MLVQNFAQYHPHHPRSCQGHRLRISRVQASYPICFPLPCLINNIFTSFFSEHDVIKPNIMRILNIWEERKIYDRKYVTELKGILENGKCTTPDKALFSSKKSSDIVLISARKLINVLVTHYKRPARRL